ncbi:MAG: hypothetical protein ACAI38_17645 [Myxococcota bacterium]|nr:hypothetical protein [Myxococcota bacterium]
MIASTVLLLALQVVAADDASASDGIPTALVIQAGYGFSAYNHKPDATSGGVYLQLEHRWQVTDWFSPRAYGGALLTWPERDSCGADQAPCDVSNKIGFVGVKARAMAPFPYIGPYLEAGGGLSFGTIKTMVVDREDIDSSGVFGHIAVGAGLALGKHREVDLGFNYLLHPGQKQIGGGLVLGMSIPL